MWTLVIYFSFITQNKQNKSAMSNTFPDISEAPPPEPLPPGLPVTAGVTAAVTAGDAEPSQNPRKGNIIVA